MPTIINGRVSLKSKKETDGTLMAFHRKKKFPLFKGKTGLDMFFHLKKWDRANGQDDRRDSRKGASR
jgi:hypothetical protein